MDTAPNQDVARLVQAYLLLRDSGMAPWDYGILGISRRRLYRCGLMMAPMFAQATYLYEATALEQRKKLVEALMEGMADCTAALGRALCG